MTAATRTQRTDGWRIHRATAVSFNARSLHCRVCSDALRHRLTSSGEPFKSQYQHDPRNRHQHRQQQLRILTGNLREAARQQVLLQHGRALTLRVDAPGQHFLPRPDLVQRAQHQPGEKSQGKVAPAIEHPAEDARETQDTDQAAGGENRQYSHVEVFYRAQYNRVQAQQYQNEAAGDARQDHRADRDGTGEKQAQTAAAPLYRSGHGDHIGECDTQYQPDDTRQIPTLDLLADQVHGDQYQSKEERPYRDRMGIEQIRNQFGQADDTGKDAAQQNKQKVGVGSRPCLPNATAEQQHRSTGNRANRPQQLVVDAGDEGDGAAGYARYHV